MKIGEFSRVGQVTVKALRVYEEMGLLVPQKVDKWSGYRDYTAGQLTRLYKILAYKDLGLSLEEIKHVFETEPTVEQIRGMLNVKSAQMQVRIEEDRRRLVLVENLIERIEKEDTMPNYSVIEKEVGDMKVVSVREVLPGYFAVGTQMNLFCQYFEKNKVQPAGAPFAIYHDLEYKESNVDIECVFPIVGEAKEYDKFKVANLKGGKFASTIHTGDFENISDAYKAVYGWVEVNGYKVTGPSREVYLETPKDGKGSFVTEIQVPIGK